MSSQPGTHCRNRPGWKWTASADLEFHYPVRAFRSRNLNVNAVPAGIKLHLVSCSEFHRRLDLASERQEYLIDLGVENVDEEPVALAGRHTPGLLRNVSGCGSINGIPVFPEPFSNAFEPVKGSLRKPSVRLRSDIEKEVGAFPGRSNDEADELID